MFCNLYCVSRASVRYMIVPSIDRVQQEDLEEHPVLNFFIIQEIILSGLMIENLTVNKRISHNKIVLSQMSYFGLYQNSKAFLTFMFVSLKRGF